jgi:hypothetical protein
VSDLDLGSLLWIFEGVSEWGGDAWGGCRCRCDLARELTLLADELNAATTAGHAATAAANSESTG